jgi:hypothetical protein
VPCSDWTTEDYFNEKYDSKILQRSVENYYAMAVRFTQFQALIIIVERAIDKTLQFRVGKRSTLLLTRTIVSS